MSKKYFCIAAVIAVIGGAGYVAVSTGMVADSKKADPKTTVAWQFADAGEVDGMPRTAVTAVINGTAYEAGTFTGSCSEIGASGGIDGKGLLAGELSAAQCWYAGGGDEIGVFAHEDDGVDIMVGGLSEGAEGAGMFRGDFTVKKSIVF